MILATDEVYTYAIFNYGEINWSSHTEAGGDTTGGEGGVPAYVSLFTKNRFPQISTLLCCFFFCIFLFNIKNSYNRLDSMLEMEPKLMNTNHTVRHLFCVI